MVFPEVSSDPFLYLQVQGGFVFARAKPCRLFRRVPELRWVRGETGKATTGSAAGSAGVRSLLAWFELAFFLEVESGFDLARPTQVESSKRYEL